MKIYEATIVNKDPDYEGHRWRVALLTKKEIEEYGELDTEEEYNDFMRKHTDNAYGDDDINFYADMEDLKEEMIITEDYVFDELEVLYYIGVTKN